MSFTINGWPFGHPHLTKIDGYPFGYSGPTAPNPLLAAKGDGYVSTFNQLFKRYQKRAAKAGREFTLTQQVFYELTSQPCYFCAAPPSQKVRKTVKNSYIYNGLDRFDSGKGYTPSNCVACCWRHNDLKGTNSFQELYRHSLAVVLSVSSKTALDIGDLRCLELLIELFPNVRFLQEHRSALLEDMKRNPTKPRWNWLLKPVRPNSS